MPYHDANMTRPAEIARRYDPRRYDHCVLPCVDLGQARAWLSALGFTVARDALHPFGTANACVYFADDTYLEPLAIHDQARYDEAIAQGNVFVRHDRAHRGRADACGFSAIAIKCEDAAGDHSAFVAQGISAGSVLAFSRPFVTADGQSGEKGGEKGDEASFRLAFARMPDMAGPLFFACQRLNQPVIDRSDLIRHDNGAMGTSGLILVAADPHAYRPLFSAIFGQEAIIGEPDGTIVIACKHQNLHVMPCARWNRLAGKQDAGNDGALRIVAAGFRVPDIEACAGFLSRRGMAFRLKDQRLLVDPVSGQEACFYFEENAP